MTIRLAPVLSTKMNNQQLGKEFEREMTQWLFEHGWWAHFLQPSPSGSQPFDVIALKDGQVLCIDCKTCGSPRFALSNVKDNQRQAFELLNLRGILNTFFAIKDTKTGEVHMAPSKELTCALDNGQKSVHIKEFPIWFTLTIN